MEKSRMYTTIDLGLNILDLNVRPEIYNGDPEMRMPGNLTEEDEILFGEKKKSFKAFDQLELYKDPSLVKLQSELQDAAKDDDMALEDLFNLDDPMITKLDILNHIRKNVDLSFQNSKSEIL
jgi:hypothetical protein